MLTMMVMKVAKSPQWRCWQTVMLERGRGVICLVIFPQNREREVITCRFERSRLESRKRYFRLFLVKFELDPWELSNFDNMITNVSTTSSEMYQDGSLLLAELHRLELEPFDCRPQSYAGPIYQVGSSIANLQVFSGPPQKSLFWS